MLGKTLVNGVAYNIDQGECLVNGVAYKIDRGKTLVNNIAYDIGDTIDLSMKGLWADAQLLGIAGRNNSRTGTATLSDITASDSQVYLLVFWNGNIGVFTIEGTNSSGKFIPTSNSQYTLFLSPEKKANEIRVSSAGITWTRNVYGVTLVAVSFPSYTVDQVTSIFENLTYVGGSGLNSSTKLNLSIPVANEQASDVMFLATAAALRVYTPPLDSATSPAPYAWSTGGGYDLGHPTGVTTNNWYTITLAGGLASFYGATLIAFKEG